MNTTGMKLAGLMAAAASGAAFAASTVTIDGVTQRWPWNNKLDIAYTVTGGQDVSQGVYRKLVFTCVIDGVTNLIDGVSDVGASASDGSHVVTWTAPAGYKTSNCTMSAALYASDVPSGDDYMILNLETRKMSFEGLLSSQEASNARYNDGWYKTTNVVLRKVAAGGTYPTGNASTTMNPNNLPTTWTTDRDYYIGVFPVTQWQYRKVFGSNPARMQTVIEGNNKDYRPVEYVSYKNLRGANANNTALAADATIPAVDSVSDGTSFFQKFNCMFGNKRYFDLPTEVMFEIAERAGVAERAFFWGDTADDGVNYCIYAGTSTGSSTMEVGAKLPNAWGLYDVAGNVYEWCLDAAVSEQLSTLPDPWTPRSEEGVVLRRIRGGGYWGNSSIGQTFRASYRDNRTTDTSQSAAWNNGVGFRVAYIVE